jgi:hypothetical protein
MPVLFGSGLGKFIPLGPIRCGYGTLPRVHRVGFWPFRRR